MSQCQQWLIDQLKDMKDYSVMEIGTRRWGQNPTHHKDWYPGAGKYVMTDFMAGEDVDVLADAHELSKVFGEASYDVIMAASVFEHLERPWIVAGEILKTLKPGGIFFIQTHQTFPVHGYPYDYFRYTRQGLDVLFKDASEKMSEYEFPCEITSERLGLMKNKQSWLNVLIAGRR